MTILITRLCISILSLIHNSETEQTALSNICVGTHTVTDSDVNHHGDDRIIQAIISSTVC